MALTQISTAGVKDDAVTSGKIPANAVGSSELADNAVDTNAILDDAVTADKLANSINTEIAANTAKTSNATHTGDVTGSTSLTIADDAVTSAKIADNAVVRAAINAEAVSTSKIEGLAVTTAKIADQAVDLTKLPHGTSSNDGKFLRANNGADPSFETVSIPAGTTINNNGDNKVITGSDTANTLQGETYVHATGATLSIGTNSPAYLANLHIRNSYASMRIDSDGSNNDTTFLMKTGTGKENKIHFGDAADDDVGIITYDHNGDHMKFTTGTSERMRLNEHGLCLGGTGASNGLDDYEEGTYDGTLSVTSGTLVMDTSKNQLSYTKIGRQCTITGRVQVSSVSGLSGYMTLNLPFSVGTSTEFDHGGAGSVFMYNAGGVGSPGYSGLWTVWTDGGLSQIYFTYGDSTTAVNGAKVSAGTEVRVTFTYLTS